jgi:hypothetical protein
MISVYSNLYICIRGKLAEHDKVFYNSKYFAFNSCGRGFVTSLPCYDRNMLVKLEYKD